MAEIAWRVQGLLRDQTDILRVPLGLIPRLPNACSPKPLEFAPGYFCSPVRRAQWSDTESTVLQDWRQSLVDKSDPILDNRLSYFDLDSVAHGTPFNWHRDHSANIDSPARLSVLTDYRDFSTNGDCKLVWEPNRHHQLVVLARAWTATGDLEYARKICELLQSWIDTNPFGYGMNWKSPLEVGIRIINWIWAIDLIRDSGVFSDTLWQKVQESLYRALWDTQRKFSRASSANNHLIGEAAGVFVGCCYFKNFPNAEKWARKSQAILEREILMQSYSDGCTREHAFGYQLFVIQFFTQSLLAGDATGYSFSDEYKRRLHQMYRFLHELCADTGRPPAMGDGDDGYVLDLGDLPGNVAGLLAVGAELFEDRGLATHTPSETVFWLTGKFGQQLANERDHRPSKSFPESGYHLLRGSRMSVFFDCAPLGFGAIAAHGHADCLSICVSVDGKPIIVDPGTFDYFTHPEWRSYFRETRAHNTVEVDGRSQSELLGPFMWGKRANARLLDWQDDGENTIVVGEHDGYDSLDDPLIHRRSLNFEKSANRLRISDALSAKDRHRVRMHFHLDPNCQVTRISDNEFKITHGTSTLTLTANEGRLSEILANEEDETGWISSGYHRRQPSTTIRLENDIDGDSVIETRLLLER